MSWKNRLLPIVVATLCSCQPNNKTSQEESQINRDGGYFVSEQDALRVATNWMKMVQRSDSNNTDIINVMTQVVTDEGQDITTSYIVNFAMGGFVIVAAHTLSDPILGYSHEGSVPENGGNPAFRAYLEQLNRDLHMSIERSNDLEGSKSLSSNRVHSQKWDQLLLGNYLLRNQTQTVEPLISATWNQGAPYNQYTPREDGSQTKVGCGAVAIGQIIHFFGHPLHGQGYKEYTWKPGTANEQTLRVEFSRSKYVWDLMPDSLSAQGVTPQQIEATARFLYETGVAVRMNFGKSVSWSNTVDIKRAFERHFRFADSLKLIYRSQYRYDEDTWVALMKNEILDGRPVFYRAATTSPGSGHFFNLDGIDAEERFHINWGWGGSQNGYFSLENGPGAYTEGNSAIIGISIRLSRAGRRMRWLGRFSLWGRPVVQKPNRFDRCLSTIRMVSATNRCRRLCSPAPRRCSWNLGLSDQPVYLARRRNRYRQRYRLGRP